MVSEKVALSAYTAIVPFHDRQSNKNAMALHAQWPNASHVPHVSLTVNEMIFALIFWQHPISVTLCAAGETAKPRQQSTAA